MVIVVVILGCFGLLFSIFILVLIIQAQQNKKNWTLGTIHETSANLKIKTIGLINNYSYSIQFVGDNEQLLPQFMEKELVAGIYSGLFFINNQPATAWLTGYYPNKKKAFVLRFLFGVKTGQGLFYDEKGIVTKIMYDDDKHPLNINSMKCAKPVIYLYPTEKTEISVKLDFNQNQLKHTYPKYNPEKGWNVIAEPNGNLKNVENGKDYYALFWEGQSQKQTEIKQGFVIKGENTAEFLEEKLAILGLNWRESNEFMMYWLPQMENNNYNLIHFSTEEYTNNFPVVITPRPDNFIRVFMVFEPLETAIEIPIQELTPVERGGFTAVEWGGAKQNKPKFGL